MSIDILFKKTTRYFTRMAKQVFGHLASLSIRKKFMIAALLAIAATYYSAPFGMIFLSVGLILEWRKSPARSLTFLEIAKRSVFLVPGIILTFSAVIGPLFFGHYINSGLAFIVIAPMMFCGVAIEILWKKEDALHFARYTAMLIIPISVLSFAFPWAGGPFVKYSEHFRLAGTFSNPNYFSYFLEITLIFIIALFYHVWKSSSRFWLSISLILSLFCLYLTGSRTGILAFFIGLTVFCFLMSEKVILSVVFGTLTIILVTVAIFPEKAILFLQDVIPRPETFLTEIKYRFMLWDVALKQIVKNPFIGTGLDSYRFLIPKDAPPVLKAAMHSHNIFINLWLETGILGILSFIWIFVRTAAKAIKVLKTSVVRPYLSAGIVMIVVTAVHGMMDAPLQNAQTIYLYGIFLGCILVMSRETESF